MKPVEFRDHLAKKEAYVQKVVRTKYDPRMDAIGRFQLRIDELDMMIADAEMRINDSQTMGYQVRNLQRKVRDLKERKVWNEMLTEGLK